MRTLKPLVLLVVLMFFAAGCASKSRQSKISSAQLDGIKSSVAKTLPPEAKVEVTTMPGKRSSLNIVISAHLLEGSYADDTSPYVRGDYGTHEKLERLVRIRCARIFKAVPAESLPGADRVVILVRHGVRHHYGSYSSPGQDKATTIYSVSLAAEQMRSRNLSAAGEEELIRLWRLESNIIPRLRITTVPF